MTVGLDPVALGLTRATFAALYKAQRAIRLYPAGHRLREASLEEFRLSTLCAVRERSIRADLGPKTLLVDGVVVFEEPASEDLLRRLAATGLCSIHIRTGVRAAELDSLVDLCAEAATDTDESSPDWAIRVWRTELPHITLSSDKPDPKTIPRTVELSPHALSSLAVGPAAPSFAAAVARETNLNLPVQVAGSILDLASSASPERRQSILAFLDALLGELLLAFDLQSAAWILDEADREISFTAAERTRLLEHHQEFNDSQWWLQCIASPKVRDSSSLGAFVLHYGRKALASILQAPELLAHADLQLALITLCQMDAKPFYELARSGSASQQLAALDLCHKADIDIPEQLALALIRGTSEEVAHCVLQRFPAALSPQNLLACSASAGSAELTVTLIQCAIDTGNSEVFECLRHALVGPRMLGPVRDACKPERIAACLAKSPNPSATELLKDLSTQAVEPTRSLCESYLARP